MVVTGMTVTEFVTRIDNSGFDADGRYRIPLSLERAVSESGASKAVHVVGVVARSLLLEQGFELARLSDASWEIRHPSAPSAAALARFVELTPTRLLVVGGLYDSVFRTVVNTYAYVGGGGTEMPTDRLRQLPALSAQIKDSVGWPLLWALCRASGTEEPLPIRQFLQIPELVVRARQTWPPYANSVPNTEPAYWLPGRKNRAEPGVRIAPASRMCGVPPFAAAAAAATTLDLFVLLCIPLNFEPACISSTLVRIISILFTRKRETKQCIHTIRNNGQW